MIHTLIMQRHNLKKISFSLILSLSLIPLTDINPTLAQAPTATAEDKIRDAIILNSQGKDLVYKDLVGLSDLEEGLKLFQQALAIFKQNGASAGEGDSLVNIGYVYLRKGENLKALNFFQQALNISSKTRNVGLQWIAQSYIGEVYVNLVDYQKAIDSYNLSLSLIRELKTANPKDSQYNNSEKNLLTDMASVYFRVGKYQKALELYKQVLATEKQEKSPIGEAHILNNIGVVYVNIGEYGQALENYQKALNIVREVGNCYRSTPGGKLCYYGDEAAIDNNLAAVYFNLGQSQKSLEFAEKAADIYKKFRSGEYQSTGQADIKLLYDSLGKNSSGLEVLSRANVGSAFGKDSFSFQGEALNLNNVGQIYLSLGQYDKALKLYQQALNLYQENNYKLGIAVSLNNLGQVYQGKSDFNQALTFNQQALKTYREIGDTTGEGITLSNLGLVYQRQNQLPKALELFQQALPIHKQVRDIVSEAFTLKHIGDILAAQNQPELAITFYKQSINTTEIIRQDLKLSANDIQKSYTEKISDRYRRAADLLLKENRPAEAQQVLDLLKIQEAEGYLKNSSLPNTQQSRRINKPQQPTPALALQTQELKISDKYTGIQDKAIGFGKELTNLRKIPVGDRTAQQEKRITELVKLEQQVTAEFNQFTKNPDVVALVAKISTTSGQENLNLRQLNALRDNLRKLDKKAILLYPLVLEDRLELVIVSADAPPLHRTVAVKREDIEKTVSDFRRALLKKTNAKKTGAQLYDWLIKPIENDIKQANAQTIIYAPDGILRYIPLGALYDGNNWLVQRYRINNITAASLTNFNSQPEKDLQILATAFTKGSYSVKIGNENATFDGLEFGGKEVDNIAAIIPKTKILIDKAFNKSAVIPQLNDYKIVHFATHAALDVDNPSDSFVLFGSGEKVTLQDISTWSLPNVDLVVLSACQTGLGGKLGDGQEILGLGYQIQLTGAKGAIASLWTIDDGGTQALMNAFYQALKSGNLTKAEALNQAQISLINGDNQFNHPYYWAPFILIGNGL
jgi:CHAT domain-containing protein/Tfp pilus assembly protein PilF